MKLRAAALAATATLATPAAADPASVPASSVGRAIRVHRRCSQLFSVRMGERAARAVYRDGHHVTLRNLRLLGYIERCQVNPHAQGFVRFYDRRHGRLHRERRYALLHPAPQLAYGKWAVPASIVMCESGGQNLPPNSAGASGYYQIIVSTWAAYGGSGSAAYLAAKGEQDAVAARIWAGGSGAGQWVCKG